MTEISIKCPRCGAKTRVKLSELDARLYYKGILRDVVCDRCYAEEEDCGDDIYACERDSLEFCGQWW